MFMQLEPNQIHVWHTDLVTSPEKELVQAALLSPDELERAKRFHAPIHRTRFIAARRSGTNGLPGWFGETQLRASCDRIAFALRYMYAGAP